MEGDLRIDWYMSEKRLLGVMSLAWLRCLKQMKNVTTERLTKCLREFRIQYGAMSGHTGLLEAHAMAEDAAKRLQDVHKQRQIIQDQLQADHDEIRRIQRSISAILDRAPLETTGLNATPSLDLLKQEHDLCKQSALKTDQLKQLETTEMECLNKFSSTLRVVHERDRLRTMNFRHWSLTSTFLGTMVGLMVSGYSYSRLPDGVVIDALSMSSKDTIIDHGGLGHNQARAVVEHSTQTYEAIEDKANDAIHADVEQLVIVLILASLVVASGQALSRLA